MPQAFPFPAAPIDALRPSLLGTLADGDSAVVCAPPGAGKSSRIPLWLLNADWRNDNRILLLEPRRVAARALARYAARLLGQNVGGLVGYRMRQESAVSAATRLEVVTEGVLTRLLQQDPSLPGVACILFDEFHERSLQADLGLALSLESRSLLRPDLRLVVMSATLDAEGAASLLGDCPILRCEGRSCPVDVRYLPPPPDAVGPAALWRHTAAVVRSALRAEQGDILVFLPGMAEIARVAEELENGLPPDTDIHPLYGYLKPAEQDAAIAPAPQGRRKIVLATSIAETSLTIEGIRIVVDTGLCRRPRWDTAADMARLVTERVSLAAADQRAGRAGRTQPGLCLRLWSREETAGLRPAIRPEILESDLAPLVLQTARWGTPPEKLHWLNTPPAPRLQAARRCLASLEALTGDDGGDHLTPLGRRMADLPLHPRTARMLLTAPPALHAEACLLAALLEEDRGGAQSDLRRILDQEQRNRSSRIRALAARLARLCPPPASPAREEPPHDAVGQLLAAAWPDRVALRTGEQHQEAVYLLRGGQAATLPLDDALAREACLAIADLGGDAARSRARIRRAAPLARASLERLFAARVRTEDSVQVTDEGRLLARRRRMLDALVLDDAPLPRPDGTDAALAFCDYLRRHALDQLPWTETLRQWQQRVLLARSLDGDLWPDISDAALLADLEGWLAPALEQETDIRRFPAAALAQALRALVPSSLSRRLDALLPTHWTAPSGRTHPVVYGAEGGPYVAVKLQECFGCRTTPSLADGRCPLTLHLLSPAGRPLQITRDLAGFWTSAYPQVRAEMRGRYPRHPWPEDPAAALPTAKTNRALSRGRG